MIHMAVIDLMDVGVTYTLCDGQPREWVARMKYLELLFQAQQGMHVTYSHLHAKCGVLGLCYSASLGSCTSLHQSGYS